MASSLQYQKTDYQSWVSTASTGNDTDSKNNHELWKLNPKSGIKSGVGSLTASILFLFITSSAYAESFGDYIGAEYVRNYDGDTITFNLREFHPIIGKGISIRVNGVDTPEIRGKCKAEKELARQAKELIGALLSKANKIDLLNLQRGKYFRLVADVIVDGINISDALLEADLAVRYDGGKKVKGWCSKLPSTKKK